MAESMDSILDEDHVEQQEEIQQEPPKQEAETQKEAETPKPEAEEYTPKEKAAFAKAQDETRKRQAVERELAELKAQKAVDKPTGEAKTFWDDAEANLKKYRDEIIGTVATTKLQMSEDFARSKYPDFDEKATAFIDLVKDTPGLLERFQSAANPAEFAYRTAKGHLEIK